MTNRLAAWTSCVVLMLWGMLGLIAMAVNGVEPDATAAGAAYISGFVIGALIPVAAAVVTTIALVRKPRINAMLISVWLINACLVAVGLKLLGDALDHSMADCIAGAVLFACGVANIFGTQPVPSKQAR